VHVIINILILGWDRWILLDEAGYAQKLSCSRYLWPDITNNGTAQKGEKAEIRKKEESKIKLNFRDQG